MAEDALLDDAIAALEKIRELCKKHANDYGYRPLLRSILDEVDQALGDKPRQTEQLPGFTPRCPVYAADSGCYCSKELGHPGPHNFQADSTPSRPPVAPPSASEPCPVFAPGSGFCQQPKGHDGLHFDPDLVETRQIQRAAQRIAQQIEASQNLEIAALRAREAGQ